MHGVIVCPALYLAKCILNFRKLKFQEVPSVKSEHKQHLTKKYLVTGDISGNASLILLCLNLHLVGFREVSQSV